MNSTFQSHTKPAWRQYLLLAAIGVCLLQAPLVPAAAQTAKRIYSNTETSLEHWKQRFDYVVEIVRWGRSRPCHKAQLAPAEAVEQAELPAISS